MYHGTTDKFLSAILSDGVLPPEVTSISSEKRKLNLDKVFLTDERRFAEGYALRAAYKHGGKPVVLTVEGENVTIERTGRVNQWTATKARVISVECIHCTEDEYLEKSLSIFRLNK